MLLKGMDREQAQLFLQQSIAQMCKVTVSFTGPIEIDGIICITGRDKDDLVLVKLHEKLTSPTVSDVDTLGSNNQDGECSLTPDLGSEPMNIAGEIEECLKRENSCFERDDDVGDSSLQPREDCTNAQDSGTAEESNTCSIAFDISDIKVEPVMLDSESEDGVNVDNTDNSEICEPGESVSHIKRQFFPDLDTTDSYSKFTRVADVDDSTADLVLVKRHEKLTSPALPGFDVSSCETEDALNADHQEKHTSDICTSSYTLAPNECEQETLKSEDSHESVQTKTHDSDVKELDRQTYKTKALPSTSGIFDNTALAGDVKAEPILLDSDYEDCVDLSDSPDESESGSSTDALHCIKRTMCAGVDPNEPFAKLMKLGLQKESVVSPQVDSVAVRSSGLTPDGTASSDASLSCSVCAEAFSEFVSLMQHVSSAHGLHICEQCLQLFAYPVLLQQHMKLHGVTRPSSVHWLCTLCRRSFRRKEHLCHHISCHQNMQLHQCGQCSKGFTARSMLQLHLSRQHGGKTEDVCRPCFMEFADAATFAQHENHHKQYDIQYTCPLCAFTADDRLALVKHGFVHFGLRVVTTA